MKGSSLLLAAALLVNAATAVAQSPAEQRMAFGGGSYFDFVIPVNAAGPLFVEATWNSGVPMHAYLFMPGHPHPIAESDGTGRLTIAREVTQWRPGQPWMLRLAAADQNPNVQGNLRIVWPSGNRPGVVAQWRNAGPTDRAVLAQAQRRAAAMWATVAPTRPVSSVSSDAFFGTVTALRTLREWDRTAYSEMLTVLQTRLQVLARTPDRYVSNDAPITGSDAKAGGSSWLAGSQALSVGFSALRCQGNSAYHVSHASDEPFIVAAVLGGGNGPVSAGRSAIFTMVMPGDTFPAPNGIQTLATGSVASTQVAVAVMEREHGTPDLSLARFLRAVELFKVYQAADAAVPADKDFGWFVGLDAADGDRLIGAPQLLTVTANGLVDASGRSLGWIAGSNGQRRVTPTLSFRSGDAQFDVAMKITSDQR